MRLCSNMRVIAMIIAMLSYLCKNSRMRIVRMSFAIRLHLKEFFA